MFGPPCPHCASVYNWLTGKDGEECHCGWPFKDKHSATISLEDLNKHKHLMPEKIQPHHVAHDHESIRTDIAKFILSALLSNPCVRSEDRKALTAEMLIPHAIILTDKLITELNKVTEEDTHPKMPL